MDSLLPRSPKPCFPEHLSLRGPIYRSCTCPCTLSFIMPSLVTFPSLAFNNGNLPSPMALLLVICCLAPLAPLRSQLRPAWGQPRLISLEVAQPCWVWGGQHPPKLRPRTLTAESACQRPLPFLLCQATGCGQVTFEDNSSNLHLLPLGRNYVIIIFSERSCSGEPNVSETVLLKVKCVHLVRESWRRHRELPACLSGCFRQHRTDTVPPTGPECTSVSWSLPSRPANSALDPTALDLLQGSAAPRSQNKSCGVIITVVLCKEILFCSVTNN